MRYLGILILIISSLKVFAESDYFMRNTNQWGEADLGEYDIDEFDMKKIEEEEKIKSQIIKQQKKEDEIKAKLNPYKNQCQELGFKEGSKKFKDCVVELME